MGNMLCQETSENSKHVLIDVFKYNVEDKYSNLASFHSRIYFLDYSNVNSIEDAVMEVDINCKYDKKMHPKNFNKKILKQKYSLPITKYNLMDWVFDILTNQLYQMKLDPSLFYIENDEIVIKKHQDKPHYICVINIIKN